jgi:uncharacterized membrane protein YedE/YeeE
MIDALLAPWPWYVAGPLIGLVVPLVYRYGGRKWGISQSLQHICAATRPRGIEYFRYDWRRQGAWSLSMVLGILVGGLVGRLLSSPDTAVAISDATRADLSSLGVTSFVGLLPADVFSLASLLTVPGMTLVLLGGFLVGFGARYANGCTSGHAISGLSSLQLSSLLAVVGFFVGGLVSTHLLLPLVLR